MSTQIINSALYPIDRLDSAAGKTWIAQIRSALQDDGSCILPNFVTAEVLREMTLQAKSIAHLAYPGPTEVTPYFFNYRLGEGEDLPADHPLRRKGRRNLAQVATDLIPTDFLLSQLHRSQAMLDFLSAVIEQPVYRNLDPYQSLNISVMDEGGCQQWHFDGGNMVTTLLLQEPEGGGVFEYAPAIRSESDENFDAVQAILDGRSTRPDMIGNRESSILHYGPRVAEIESTTPRYP
jgi:hypothetical protein